MVSAEQSVADAMSQAEQRMASVDFRIVLVPTWSYPRHSPRDYRHHTYNPGHRLCSATRDASLEDVVSDIRVESHKNQRYLWRHGLNPSVDLSIRE